MDQRKILRYDSRDGSTFLTPIQALLGKAKFLEMKKQFGQALDHINHVVVLYPWFTPALTEKARVLIMSSDWEQAIEVAQRVVTQVSLIEW